MDRNKLKAYAPAARRDFIQAMKARAALLGISEQGIVSASTQGDVAIIQGLAYPKAVEGRRQRLVGRIEREGFEQVMEAMAYTWFNRFAALRYMELHGYFEHGYRVLSHPEGKAIPEILEKAEHLDLPGLRPEQVVDLKLEGKDQELYRLLLVAQCNALHLAMPFLFESIEDETELLLPENLLHSDSLIRHLVNEIQEADWQEVEIIGWLYQFYISEKKDQVIGKVVKSEDIPAATQLFTPNWIVKYLVQNSLGRLWMQANPSSDLKARMVYYIEPAEQSLAVQTQLDSLIKVRMDEDGGTLNPETLTLLDPACGSGHILVEAYNLLKEIYLERGYQPRAIPRLILEKNLFGLDIDDRAAQLAGFALLMRGRADDRRLFEVEVGLNVLSIQDSSGLDIERLASQLVPLGIKRGSLIKLIEEMCYAKTYGSLINVSKELKIELMFIDEILQKAILSVDLYTKLAAEEIYPLVLQGIILSKHYDAVVANPPYMGSKGMTTVLKEFAKVEFPHSKSDLFAMFIERGFFLCKPMGFNSMVTIQSWMFLSSFEGMRDKLLRNHTFLSMNHMGSGVMGIAFGTVATNILNVSIDGYRCNFSYCDNSNINNNGIPINFPIMNERLVNVRQEEFYNIPGNSIIYWISDSFRNVFKLQNNIEGITISDGQNKTGDNSKFLRFFWEVSNIKIEEKKWIPYAKGGEWKKWYGNVDSVINWSDEARNFYKKDKIARLIPSYLWYKKGITWSFIAAKEIGFRYLEEGGTFDVGGSTVFFENENNLLPTLALLNSKPAISILKFLNPTVNLQVENVRSIPIPSYSKNEIEAIAVTAIEIAKKDWDSYEGSQNFTGLDLVLRFNNSPHLCDAWKELSAEYLERIKHLQLLEEKNNSIFIDAYKLMDELTPEVSDHEITLSRPHREKDAQRLLSYAVGCMMGRFSLDKSGLVYAHAGNVDFNPSDYLIFAADEDGIIPVTEFAWFPDDAALRFETFVKTIRPAESLETNLAWVAESLLNKKDESPRECLRRYFATGFFKDHLQTFKRRPIYWLFSSGKERAFQALVYLHRYSEGTLARMRTEYVIPLQGRINGRIDKLREEISRATSTAHSKTLQKEMDTLRKQQVELHSFDEKLRHYADLRIGLDLDDGVKVNYGKFGDLLAEVKAVTGGKEDE